MFGRKSLRGIESLEKKELLACDVAFDGAALDIRCDGADDLVNVLTLGDSLLVDVGDGQVDVGSPAGLAELDIRSGGGDDNVVLTNVSVSDSIKIDTGVGDDRVTMSLLDVGNDLNIKTGVGDDRVSFIFGATVGDSVNVKTGAGDDTVEVLPFSGGLVAANDIKIDGKAGNDTFIGESNVVAGDDLVIKSFEVFEPGFPFPPF